MKWGAFKNLKVHKALASQPDDQPHPTSATDGAIASTATGSKPAAAFVAPADGGVAQHRVPAGCASNEKELQDPTAEI